MGFETIHGSIEKFFTTGWAGRTLIEYANVELQDNVTDSYVRLSVLTGESFLNGFSGGGKTQNRTAGIIVVSIFIPSGSGTAEADGHADFAKSILRGAHFDGITCLVPSLDPVGRTGIWYQANLLTPFNIDEIE